MPFQKGKSGNPGGRPKRKAFREALDMELKALPDDDQRGLRKVARTLIERAEAGDAWAIRELADRLDGKPAQALEHGLGEGGDLADLLQALDGTTRGLPNR